MPGQSTLSLYRQRVDKLEEGLERQAILEEHLMIAARRAAPATGFANRPNSRISRRPNKLRAGSFLPHYRLGGLIFRLIDPDDATD